MCLIYNIMPSVLPIACPLLKASCNSGVLYLPISEGLAVDCWVLLFPDKQIFDGLRISFKNVCFVK